ncbi:MAG: hypothetical protein K9K67_13020 [Bacteriovoracaceae bacterium]|nr:hypothetical protein [Bacteriovoracaceae bacterium]
MKVFYFSESNYRVSRIRSLIETAVDGEYVDFLHFPLNDLLYFEDYEEGKTLIIDLSPWDEILLPSLINPLKILEKSGCLVEAKVFVILGSKPTPKVEATLATCPLIQSMYVVGGDQDVFFNFLVQELTGKANPIEFAALKGMNVETPCLFPISLRKFKKEYAIFASHNQIPWEKIEVQDSLFEYFSLNEVSLRDAKRKEKSFEYTFSLPLVNHKGALKKGEVNKGTFEGHINKQMNQFLQNQNDVAIIGEGEYFKRIASLMDYESNSHVTHYEDFTNIFHDLNKLQPELIILNLNDLEEDNEGEKLYDGLSTEQCQALFEEIKKISFYSPVIIVFNSKSDSGTLQDLFGYQKILSLNHDPSREFILNLINKYRSSTQREITLEKLIYPRPEHPFSSGWVKSTITLHEISESNVTFSYQGEIILGSWIRLEFPFPLSLYVYEESASNCGANFKGYKGKIMGLFGLEEYKLRVFINLAFQDPQEFLKYYVNHPTFLKDHLDKHLKGLGVPNEEELAEKKRVEADYLKKLAEEKEKQKEKENEPTP